MLFTYYSLYHQRNLIDFQFHHDKEFKFIMISHDYDIKLVVLNTLQLHTKKAVILFQNTWIYDIYAVWSTTKPPH